VIRSSLAKVSRVSEIMLTFHIGEVYHRSVLASNKVELAARSTERKISQ
jgi:hypothetical protein